jgi:cell wall-associated NlpC family hydrolase
VAPSPTPTRLPPGQLTAAPAQPAGGSQTGSRGDRIAEIAQRYLGYRYLWGGHSPQGFDCTGLTWYVYKEAGLNIPQHDLQGQMNAGSRVEPPHLRPGDLVFFQNTYRQGLSHSGIYLGNGRFIQAETEAVGVQIRSLTDPYWSTRLVGASRPW